ncbi:MAG: dynamin family protein [Bdellovibrionota bacterium]
MSVNSVQELCRLSKELERSIPQIKGVFSDLDNIEEKLKDSSYSAIIVVGTIKAGKSSLVNALVGHDILPRGSGVKSLNLTMISNTSDTAKYKIKFRQPHMILSTLKHDFRMLGQSFQWEDPYHPDFIKELKIKFNDLQKQLDSENRIDLQYGTNAVDDLIHSAFVRIAMTIKGIEIMNHEFPSQVKLSISANELVEGSVTENYTFLHLCMHSKDLIPLIDFIYLDLPYAGSLSPAIKIVDCQGSDSLNPLDISSVRSALYASDGIVYVVNSRLGLRKGDFELLKTIRESKLSCPIAMAVNVEHFDNLAKKELDESVDNIRSNAERILGREVHTYTVDALFELQQVIEKQKTATSYNPEIRSLQKKENLQNDLHNSFLDLCTTLENISNKNSDIIFNNSHGNISLIGSKHLPLAKAHALNLSKGLLSRDKNLGSILPEINYQEFNAIIFNYISQQVQILKSKYASHTDSLFQKDKHIYKMVEDFLHKGSEDFFNANTEALQSNLENNAHNCFHVAVNTFMSKWLLLNLKLKEGEIPLLLQELKKDLQSLASTTAHYSKNVLIANFQLPSIIAEELNISILKTCDAFTANKLATTNLPDFVEPVLIHDAIRHTILMESYSKNLLRKFLAKIKTRSSQVETENTSLSARRCILKTLKACFSVAKSNYKLNLRSAQENYKFQFFYNLIDSIQTLILETYPHTLKEHLESEKKKCRHLKPLLNKEEREQIEKFIFQIDRKS